MKFKHKMTGIVEDVTNEALIPQYIKHTETYAQVKAEEKPKTARTKSK